MADENTDIPPMDYDEHERTYAGFVTGTKYSIIGCAIILILMAIFL